MKDLMDRKITFGFSVKAKNVLKLQRFAKEVGKTPHEILEKALEKYIDAHYSVKYRNAAYETFGNSGPS